MRLRVKEENENISFANPLKNFFPSLLFPYGSLCCNKSTLQIDLKERKLQKGSYIFADV